MTRHSMRASPRCATHCGRQKSGASPAILIPRNLMKFNACQESDFCDSAVSDSAASSDRPDFAVHAPRVSFWGMASFLRASGRCGTGGRGLAPRPRRTGAAETLFNGAAEGRHIGRSAPPGQRKAFELLGVDPAKLFPAAGREESNNRFSARENCDLAS